MDGRRVDWYSQGSLCTAATHGKAHHVECYPPLTALRQLRGFFTDHAEQRGLERELSIYTSEKDLTEMGAILDRYSDTETGDIRRILGARI